MDSNTRMAFNTLVLYAQLIITVAVNLFSTRLILNAMGVEDYGIVNLIAGIVAMLSFIQNSMAVSSQRYMSVNMGKNDSQLQHKVFNTSFLLHIFFFIGLLVILEILQPIVFNSSIQIPIDRVESALVLYQLTVIGSLLIVLTVPFDATMNAHENMLMFSIFSIVESLIRLGGALFLLVYNHDKLIFYGILIILIRLVGLLLKWCYCKFHYLESRICFHRVDKKLMKEMLSFAFWNMFGAFALTGRNQGLAVMLNTFFGVAINASYGIANQVGGQLSNFTSVISKAMNPQIMKNAGAMHNNKVIKLSLVQCKMTSLLMLWFVIPLLLTLPYVLKLWLATVPEYCIVFCQYFLLVNLINQMSTGLMAAVQSSGKIMKYQIIVSIIILSNLPMAYFALNRGFPPQSVLVCMVMIEVACMLFRAIYVQRIFSSDIIVFFKGVLIPVVFVFILSLLLSLTFKLVLNNLINLGNPIITIILSVFFTAGCTLFVLTSEERSIIFSILHKFKRKFGNEN